MDCQRDQTAMHKVGELYLLTKDPRDETELVTLTDHGPLRSMGPIAPWTPHEDERLRFALAKYIHLRPVPWLLVAKEFPWKPLVEVFKRINKFLQGLQGELLSQAVHLSSNRPVGPGSVGPSQQLVQLQPREKYRNPNLRKKYRNPNSNPSSAVEEKIKEKRSVPQPWTEEEKENFVKGIEAHGWGSWKLITETFVPSRTPLQLASHAQKIKKKDQISSTSSKKRKYDDVGSGTRSESPAPPEE